MLTGFGLMQTVLAIAGFDPSSGAGITADLAVFAAHGLFGTSAITALTSQSTLGVRSVLPIGRGFLLETLEELEADLPASGIKIGMLGSADGVAAVISFLERLFQIGRRPVVVLDPVLRSTSGRVLLDDGGIELMRAGLLPLVDWATPNLGELRLLLGATEELSRGKATKAGEELQRRYPRLGLVVTGGDLEPPDDLLMIAGGGQQTWIPGTRVDTAATHGTGCAFSSALLSRLVLGDEAVVAVRSAKDYVAEAMRRATPHGAGHGPMEHLWPLRTC